MEQRLGRLAKILLIAGGVSYPLLLHWAALGGTITEGRMAVIMAPVLAFGLWAALARGRRLVGALLVASSLVLVAMVAYWPDLGFALACGLPHAAANASLLWFFGRTLGAGRIPLITRLAQTVHGKIAPEVEAYTRRVTLAWTVFFAGQLVISLVLCLWAPVAAWSLFINVLNGPLVVLMFVGEYVWRHLRYRDFPRSTLMQAVRAFARSSAVATADVSGR